MNNRFFIAGCFLLVTYSSLSLICMVLLFYMGDALFGYISVHFLVTLLMLAFSLFWRKAYFRQQLHESESAAGIYTWTLRLFTITFILYTLLYLLFAGFLLLVPGNPDY